MKRILEKNGSYRWVFDKEVEEVKEEPKKVEAVKVLENPIEEAVNKFEKKSKKVKSKK